MSFADTNTEHAIDYSIQKSLHSPCKKINSVDFSPNEGCLIASGQVGLITKDKSIFVNEPVTRNQNWNDNFQRSIDNAFNQARKVGQKSPIIVGAIPFNTDQPSSLYVPQSYRFLPIEELNTLGRFPRTRQVQKVHSQPNRHHYENGVKSLLNLFEFSQLDKAVLSRKLEIELQSDPDPIDLLSAIIFQNPNSYYFSIPQMDGSIFMGASPELLVRRHGMEVSANPLAGSVARQSCPQMDKDLREDLLRSEKDLREHHVVVEEIKRILKPYCISLNVPDIPSLISTSTMWHLSSKIQGWLANQAEASALRLACALHPTPAVCGFPTNEARKIIQELEQYDRGLFTGIVGWADAHGNGDWAVAIRCGLVNKNHIRLYAGAGVVAGSQPQKEWLETEAKLSTMLKAMGITLPQTN